MIETCFASTGENVPLKQANPQSHSVHDMCTTKRVTVHVYYRIATSEPSQTGLALAAPFYSYLL